jgi:hypothetical protein
MYSVKSVSPFDAKWEQRDQEIYDLVGISGGAGMGKGVRDHLWVVDTIEEAISLKEKLETISGVTATFREHTTY